MAQPTRLAAWLVAIAVLVAACSSAAPPTAAPTAASPTFDVFAVEARFVEECKDPIIVDDLFCKQVKIAEMTAGPTGLTVPTNLDPAARARAAAICEQIARAHLDANGQPLGYKRVGIKDMNGGNAASCSITN